MAKKREAAAKKKVGRAKPKAKKAVRKSAKRSARRAAPKKKIGAMRQIAPEATLEKIGEVSHYFPKVKAAAITIMKDGLKIGDEIYIKGHTTNFKEKIISMQLDHVAIQEGKKGQEIGLLVKSRVRIGDSVYKV